MTLQALLFDVDGTLADTEEAHLQAFNAAFRQLELPWEWSRTEYAELLTTTGGKERIERYIDSMPGALAQRTALRNLVPLIHRTKTRIFAELVEMGGVRLRPGVARLVREARDAGVQLAIASTTSPQNVEALLIANLGLPALSWFSVIATGDVVARKKPAPDIYHHALASLRVPADAAAAIEDSALGVRAATAAGVYTVATPTRWTLSQDLRAADLVIGSLGDPDVPVDPASERAIGGRYLSLARLAELHAAARERARAA
jgi:HAD superfamily hydrolase (TIGR01509 family)